MSDTQKPTTRRLRYIGDGTRGIPGHPAQPGLDYEIALTDDELLGVLLTELVIETPEEPVAPERVTDRAVERAEPAPTPMRDDTKKKGA